VLEATQISFFYGHKPVLREINMQIGSGEIVAFIGPNGSGKSTLLRCLTGIFQPQQGQVKLDGGPAGGAE
jgi:ABC-type cobalamin/Fe3+-siderophores transport system ATPase subunit